MLAYLCRHLISSKLLTIHSCRPKLLLIPERLPYWAGMPVAGDPPHGPPIKMKLRITDLYSHFPDPRPLSRSVQDVHRGGPGQHIHVSHPWPVTPSGFMEADHVGSVLLEVWAAYSQTYVRNLADADSMQPINLIRSW